MMKMEFRNKKLLEEEIKEAIGGKAIGDIECDNCGVELNIKEHSTCENCNQATLTQTNEIIKLIEEVRDKTSDELYPMVEKAKDKQEKQVLSFMFELTLKKLEELLKKIRGDKNEA